MQGIIKAAVSGNDLRLELNYQMPATPGESGESSQGPLVRGWNISQDTDQPISNELACLLSMI